MPDYLTTRELAARWRVTPEHLRALRSAGRGPAWTRPGRDVLYRLDDVERREEEGAGAHLACRSCDSTGRQNNALRTNVRALRQEVSDAWAKNQQHARMGRLMGARIDELEAEVQRLEASLRAVRS